MALRTTSFVSVVHFSLCTSTRVRLIMRDARGSIGFCIDPGARTETINETQWHTVKPLYYRQFPRGPISAIELHWKYSQTFLYNLCNPVLPFSVSKQLCSIEWIQRRAHKSRQSR